VGSSARENYYLLHWTTRLSLAWLAVLAGCGVVHSFMDEITNMVLVQVQEKPEHQHVH